MNKCDITVTMPIEKYEMLKENAEWQEKRYKTHFSNLQKFIDVDETETATKIDTEGLLAYLTLEIYEVKYDL